MLSKQIVRVLFNAVMEIRAEKGAGIVQAGMKFISMFYKLTYREIPLIRPRLYPPLSAEYTTLKHVTLLTSRIYPPHSIHRGYKPIKFVKSTKHQVY